MTDPTIPTATGPFTVTAELRQGLYARYPGVDVQKELALMHLWLAKNPARVKTLTKPIRFVEAWLGKCNKPNNGATTRAESRTQAQPRGKGDSPPPVAPPTLVVDNSFRSHAGPRDIREIMAGLQAQVAAHKRAK